LFTHDVLYLAQAAQPRRHPGVDSRRNPTDQSCPQHQVVAGDLGVGRGFLEGGDEEPAGEHRGLSGKGWCLNARILSAAWSCTADAAPDGPLQPPVSVKKSSQLNESRIPACLIARATARTSASSWSMGATRYSGASGSANIPGSFLKVASSTAKVRSRPCTGSCMRKWAFAPNM